MWLFEKKGFVSVVAYDPTKDMEKNSPFKKIAKKAGTHVLVRARIEEDLDSLKEVVPSLVVDTQPKADYSFRAVVSRAQFKKYMNRVVDGITYDSHFKEACRDAAPKATGRYGALMDIWSTMAKLQPYKPYSGYAQTSGPKYGTTYTGGNGYVSPYGSDAKKAKKDRGPREPYQMGEAPLHGLEPGDTVKGFSFAAGKVLTVVGMSEKKADLVTVEYKVTKWSNPTKGAFLANFLAKIDPDEVPEENGVTADEAANAAKEHLDNLGDGDDGFYDLDWVYDYAVSNPDVHGFDPEELASLDDDAFEFITRLQEEFDSDPSKEDIERVYDEIRWERGSKAEKIQIASTGEVPEKFVAEATALLENLDSA